MINPFHIEQKKHTVSEHRRLVGAYVPQQVHDYLSLLAVYQGVAKASVIEGMISHCSRKEPPTEQIIDRLSTRVLSEWNNRIRENLGRKGWRSTEDENYRREEYCLEMKQKLGKRGITKKHIELILHPLTSKE